MVKYKGKLTGFTRKELEDEVLTRMDALDVSDEEFTNKELLNELIEVITKR